MTVTLVAKRVRVSAADDNYLLPREEEAVAGRARRNAMADELLLVRQAQPSSRRTAGNNQSLGMNLMNSQMEQERPLAQVCTREMRHAVFGAETFGLLAHVLDELRAENALRKPGKILDERGHGKLSAGLVAFDNKRLQVGARRV
jgi:hypothetical protein